MSSNSLDVPSVEKFVSHKIQKLYSSYNAGNSSAKKQFSNLRRAVNQNPAKNPLAWQYVISSDEDSTFPEKQEYRTGDTPTPTENAIYSALALYAVHQQSEQRIMHASELTFGNAVGQLVVRRTSSIKRRFDSLLQARTFESATYHARSLVQLLKQEEIPFDYGRFAADLAKLQNPRTRSGVITRWSRDFTYGYSKSFSEDSSQNKK
ncbi:type I-E CRISPR-associated protein Cse2/CasB [Rothia terrae]|uniref:type I-E CRISPR-associated protein Cse2/CasB n=1 Tax=Rothia terrae TaxID=396015 RepID=UPI0028823005|nr:type I-E CRISPR-associated protein Cse2/CasB [Rothia terrae]MDT0189635.1 type I-E CRISPR-associated protein Cse2/CasB [Rothia terrae]